MIECVGGLKGLIGYQRNYNTYTLASIQDDGRDDAEDYDLPDDYTEGESKEDDEDEEEEGEASKEEEEEETPKYDEETQKLVDGEL